ncbi:hypothetical protein ACULN0_10965 [Pectobacterium actinidiae]|uniref:hypothetical protein n=1 Tax=Pectobacterium actinidiae TaxID=1507808 RepID=UPI0040409F94
MTDLLSKEAVADIYTAVVHVEAQQGDDARLSAGFEVEQLLEQHGGYHGVMRRLIDMMRTNERELVQLREAAEKPVTVPDHLTYIKEPTLQNVLSDDDNSPMAHAARILAREVKFWRSQPLFTAPPLPVVPPAQHVAAWMVLRAGDKTFPRLFKSEEEADLMIKRVELNPMAVKVPLAQIQALPVVPDEIDVNDPALDTHRKWMAEGWNRCRAAMLQLFGNSEQVDFRAKVRKLLNMGSLAPDFAAFTGIENAIRRSRCLSAIEAHMSVIVGNDEADGSPVEGSLLNWGEEPAKYLETFRSVLPKFFSGNSPVIPEGWALAPLNANTAMIKAGGTAARKHLEETGGNSPSVIYSAMLAAAPQPMHMSEDL